jgi:hypothetical protein
MKPTYIQGNYKISPRFNNEYRLAYGTSALAGGGSLNESESINAILYALENGISIFDTSCSYADSELFLKNCFKQYFKKGVDGKWLAETDLISAIQVNEIAKENKMPLPTPTPRYFFSIEEADSVVMGAKNRKQIKATTAGWNLGKL